MGMAAAYKAQRILANAQRVVAAELLCAAQGLEFLKPAGAGRRRRGAVPAAPGADAGRAPRWTQDRPPAPDLERLALAGGARRARSGQPGDLGAAPRACRGFGSPVSFDHSKPYPSVPLLSPSRMNLEKLKDSARKFEQKEDWRKAIEVYLKAIQQIESGAETSPDLSLYNRVGDLYLKINDTASAVRSYERAVDLYADQGFFNNAIALCGKILRVNPGRTQTYLKLAQLHARKNVVIEAKRNLIEFLERMNALGQLDQAFQSVKEFADQFSGSQEIRMMLVELLRAASREEEALRAAREDGRRPGDARRSEHRAIGSPARPARRRRRRPDRPPPARGGRGDLVFLDTGFDVPTAPGPVTLAASRRGERADELPRSWTRPPAESARAARQPEEIWSRGRADPRSARPRCELDAAEDAMVAEPIAGLEQSPDAEHGPRGRWCPMPGLELDVRTRRRSSSRDCRSRILDRPGGRAESRSPRSTACSMSARTSSCRWPPSEVDLAPIGRVPTSISTFSTRSPPPPQELPLIEGRPTRAARWRTTVAGARGPDRRRSGQSRPAP